MEIPTAETVIKGNFYAIYVNDEFEAYGNWIDTGRNGYQFNIIKAKLIFPETSKGMVSFIQKYVKGVGKKTATKIVETFQENTMQVIRNGWEEIAKIDGISEKKAKRIHDSISIQRDFEEVLCFLLEYGVSYMNSIEIYEIFGYGAIEKIRENPYILCDYSKMDFIDIDIIAKRLKVAFNNMERVKQGILYYITNEMKNKGDIFVFKDLIINELSSFLNKVGAYRNTTLNYNDINNAMEELERVGKIITELNEDSRECVYISFYNLVENEIVKNIIDIIMKFNQELD